MIIFIEGAAFDAKQQRLVWRQIRAHVFAWSRGAPYRARTA